MARRDLSKKKNDPEKGRVKRIEQQKRLPHGECQKTWRAVSEQAGKKRIQQKRIPHAVCAKHGALFPKQKAQRILKMYLHLGQDYLVKTGDIIGIFDIDTASVAKNTRLFLKKAETEGAVVPLSSEIPKSFILADFPAPTVYISPISAATLKKRCARGY